jgi:hypothetical protein
LRPGAKREPVLAAWGFTIEGRRVLLHMMAGSKEDAETVTAFFEDMKRRGLNDPLLVTSDGAPGIIKAIEICFPRAARQRCLAQELTPCLYCHEPLKRAFTIAPSDGQPEMLVLYCAPCKHVETIATTLLRPTLNRPRACRE